MLWKKSWRDTRWQFLIGLAIALCSAALTVLAYPRVLEILTTVNPDLEGEISRRIQEKIALARDYRGYLSSEWFNGNLRNLATIFAVLLGVAGALTPSRGALFTLSLPISRRRLLGIHASAGLLELFALTLVPSMLIPLLSPSIRQSYDVASAALNGLAVFLIVSAYFFLALLLATIMRGIWPPLVIAMGIAWAMNVAGIGAIESAVAAPVMGYAAMVLFTKRDF